MSAKFTRGPWRIANFGVYGADGKEVIARGLPLAHGQGGSEANSALILASPMLYEALSFLEFSSGDCGGFCPYCGQSSLSGHQSGCIINNALRAARGEG